MLDSYIAIVTHPMLILFLTMCAVAYLFLALISLPKDGERHWADLKLPFFARLGLSDLPTPILLLGSVIWGMLFAVFGFGLFWVVWKLIVHEQPNLAVAADDEKAADLRWSLLTLTAMTASLSAVVALPFTLLRLQFTGRQTEATEQGLITDRINKAVEGLGAEKSVKTLFETPRYKVDPDGAWLRDENGNPIPALGPDGQPLVDRQTLETTEPNLEVRIGAIYSLERISQDSARDRLHILKILSTYIQQNSQNKLAPKFPETWIKELHPQFKHSRKAAPDFEAIKEWSQGLRRPTIDLETALNVICSIENALFLNGTISDKQNHEEVPKVVFLDESVLQKSNLSDAILMHATMKRSNFQGSNFFRANLHCANFREAHLQGVKFEGASLKKAVLTRAKMHGADLSKTYLQGAELKNTRLQMANLNGATFDADTNFDNAALVGTALRNNDLSKTTLNKFQLESAFGDRSVILSDLQKGFFAPNEQPAHWNYDVPPPSVEKFTDEWRAWQRDVLRMNPDGTDMDADPDPDTP